MSVRVNDRHLSDIEYENTYSKLNEYISSKLRRLPKRYSYFLSRPFNNVLNNIYRDIIELTNLYMSGKQKGIDRYRLCGNILNSFKEVISLSYTYWNLSGSRQNQVKYINKKQREFWTDFVNKEIALIVGVMKKCNVDKNLIVEVPNMKAYTKGEVNQVIFLEKLSSLQKIIYKRAIHTSKDYQDARMDMLVSLSRSALYNALQGNDIFVGNDEKLYKRRSKLISDAISDLYAMNRPIKELSFNDIFSETELENICNLLTNSIKILKSIRTSDDKSFHK